MSKDAVDRFFAAVDDAADHGGIEAASKELLQLMETGGVTVADLEKRRDELNARFDDARLRAAATTAKMATFHLAASQPVSDPDYLSAGALPAPGGPSRERLLAALLLLEQAHETVPVDEETVVRSLDPLREPDFSNYSEVFAGAVGVLRTAAYYVLDARDAFDALASEPPAQETFPPLPFPRVWIENRVPGIDRPAPYLRYELNEQLQEQTRPDRWSRLDVLGIGLVEIERSHVWDIYIAFRFVNDIAFFIAQRIGPDQVLAADSATEEIAPYAFATVRRLAVGGAHLVVAKNVPHEDVTLPRHQRKRLMPAIGPSLPRIYFVNLGAAGEHDERETGREYHVRWLVRGHWRHVDSGRELCSCCNPRRVATWIEPYVKGPAGAPWKGRPVHRVLHGHGEEPTIDKHTEVNGS